MIPETDNLVPPMMQRIQRIESLRPMTSGEMLDLSTKAFREVGSQILKPTFGAAVLVYIAFMMMTQLLLPQLFFTKNPGDIYAQVAEVVTAVVLGLLAALPIVIVGFSVIVTHSVHAVSDFMANRRTHQVERMKRADADLGKSIKLMIRMSLIAFSGVIGTIALLLISALLNQSEARDLSAFSGAVAVLAGIFAVGILAYTFVRYSLAPAAMLLEGAKPKEACQRSINLLRSYRGAGAGDDTVLALGFLLLLVMLFLWGGIAFIYNTLGVVQWLSTVVGRYWWGEVAISLVSGIPYMLGFWLVVPIWSVGTTVVFYERRIRLEGYDIELMNHELASKNRR